MKKMTILILAILFSLISHAEKSDKKSIEEKENELIDFNSIKKILNSDQLSKQVTNKKIKIKTLKKKRVLNRKLKFEIPSERNIWTFLSEVWLIQNASIVKWDFQKPDYGIETTFKDFLEKNGYYEKTIKILLVNTPK